MEENNEDELEEPFWVPGEKSDNEYLYERYTTLVYFHPYFTYHAIPPDAFLKYHDETKIPPYSIGLVTCESNGTWNDRDPRDFDEKSVIQRFGHFIQWHQYGTIIPEFLDWQYGAYVKKSAPNADATAFVEYVIYAIENYGSWNGGDIFALKAVGRWIRSHPGFIEGFDQRLRNWVYLHPDIKKITDQEYQNTQLKEIEPSTALESINLQNLEQMVLALYYYYLQEARYIKPLAAHPLGLMKAFDEIAERHGVGPKNFQLKFNSLRHDHIRISRTNHSKIKKVIPLLKDYPSALEIAEKELKMSEFM